MDDTDKKILNIIQTRFPICHAPYEAIGQEAQITEDEAFERVKALVDDGIIRRIGASFDSRGLGWTSTLCAMTVPPEAIEDVAAVISEYPGVTHNYERNHKYNLWFTLIAPDLETVDRTLREIEEKSGHGPVRNMPMSRKFKIKVDFKFKEEKEKKEEVA
ncbi:Heme biosynthesis protein related to NirD and NirG [hydrothermal vent metagenome]|uniref:siroheme decarboxylase n=1 Tax=hydrothermal vent metagenome TaxID=652676 RepID=A0A3B1BXV4_9ZZZZ